MSDSASEGREVLPGIVVSGERIGAGARDRHPSTWVELARFVADVGRLLWAVARDPRVPWTSKVVAGAAFAYVLSPIDLVPDFLPGIGQLDDLLIIARALRHLAGSAGYDLLHEHWGGSDDGFALLLAIAGVRA